ncbi:hypothetical protein NQ315_003096, partial [Exocentrus adspersus]
MGFNKDLAYRLTIEKVANFIETFFETILLILTLSLFAASQFNTYVTLKLQNVKSTTVTVKGATPCWEQDFLFETNDLNTGLLIEVWSKGMIWDRAMGYHWIPLQTVQYSNEEGNGQWLSLEAELVMRDGEVVGTKTPTGHSLLVDCRFELPFDPENIEASDLQRKLEMLNNIMDQEARAEQARRQMQYFGHSYDNHFDNEISAGYSEDSDYTSDLNYPVGQHANSSASQFRSAAHQINTPQRSLETSRENSYERDEAPNAHHTLPQPPATHQHHLSPGTHRRHHQRYSEEYATLQGQNSRQYQDNSVDSEPLFYNSRPRNKTDYTSQEAWVSCESSFYNQSVDSIDAGYSVDMDYYGSHQVPTRTSRALRRPSLERQTTLYDDSYYGDTNYYANAEVTKVNYMVSSHSFRQKSCDEYFDSLSYPFQDERYGQDEEDRQWDSGGFYPKVGKKLPAIPVVQNHVKNRVPPAVDEGYPSYEESYRPTATPVGRRRMPRIPTKRSASRQSSLNESFDGYRTPENTSHRGASLPPTPTKNTKLPTRLTTQSKPFNSLPPTPGRQLPRPNLSRSNARTKRNNLMKRTSSADYADNADSYDNYYIRPGAVSARETYNEDYNYAYQSIDNLQAQTDEADAAPMTNLSDNRTVANANYLQAKTGAYQDVHIKNEPYVDDYYYQDQDYNDYEETLPPRRKRLLGKRATSPLLQQNTDSLESRDDELKDSFETAVSSMSSSLHQLKSTPYSEYSTAGEVVLTNTTPTIAQADILQKTTSNAMQYPGDQQHNKAIANNVLPSVTVAQVHNNTSLRIGGQSRGVLKQQQSLDNSYYQQQQQQQLGRTVDERNNYVDEYHEYADHDTGYLETQESVESYVEEETEDTVTNGMPADYNTKAITHDSPSSVIHVDNYEDDHNLRRGSSQITVVDPYHPSLQRSAPSRRSSGADVFPRRTSSDLYHDDQFLPSSRKPSVEIALPRRASVRHSPSTPDHHQNIPEVLEDEQQEKKSVSFEEEEEHKEERPQVTAQQRWLWAYNKIIMQLNVSRFYCSFDC